MLDHCDRSNRADTCDRSKEALGEERVKVPQLCSRSDFFEGKSKGQPAQGCHNLEICFKCFLFECSMKQRFALNVSLQRSQTNGAILASVWPTTLSAIKILGTLGVGLFDKRKSIEKLLNPFLFNTSRGTLVSATSPDCSSDSILLLDSDWFISSSWAISVYSSSSGSSCGNGEIIQSELVSLCCSDMFTALSLSCRSSGISVLTSSKVSCVPCCGGL